MKKFLLFASALAGLFLAASCQRESLEPEVTGGVTYEISLPDGPQTKGETGYATYSLHYEVYKTADAATLAKTPRLFEKTVTMTSNPTTVTLDLLNDQDYTVLFWATKEGTDYFDLTDLRAVGVKQASSNNDDRDAFCGMDQIVNHDAAQSKTVTLTRPFAQLNIATLVTTGDYDIEPKSSLVKLTSIPTAYNVFTGEPVGANTEVTYTVNTVPAGDLTVNGTAYKKVAMNYLLVPESNISVYYEINTLNGTVKNTIENVPVKKNYRTNIIGNLLTSNATYTVEIKPGFEEEQYYGPEFVREPAYDADTKTYTVVDPYELLWVAQQVNTGAKDFYGETVQLAADIDLENKPWTPIGLSTSECFKGMFEGVALTKAGDTYPTIKNLYIENGNCAGLFKVLCNGGKARNFNMKHVRISGERQLGAVAGTVYSSIENVTVEDVEITAVPAFDGTVYDNGDKVGGIAGLDGQSATISGCTVKNATFKGYRDMGGIIGSTQNSYPTTITGNTVENLKFIVTSFYTPYMDDAEAGHYAPVRGGRRSNADDKVENNTGDDITLHKVLVEAAEGAIYDAQEKVYTVTSPAGLEKALEGAGAAGAGDHTIKIESDLDMTGKDWTPIKVDGYHGADIVTVEGNGATIKGLDGALFAGGFAGGSGIVIKDLTIEGAHMIADNTKGYGAFVNCADSMDEITLINCHLKNSTIITPNDGAAESRIGGLVGWTAGYNNQNDGPVDSYITIQNCSVTGCTLKGAGSIGGICGHAGANAATFTTIENCTVTGNTLVSTDDGDWRVGAIVGTANNGQCKINNVTVSGNTISQVGKTAEVWQSEIYGRFVPAGTGTLKIDGVAISATKPALVDGYTALYTADGEYFIYNLDGFQDLHTFFSERYKNPFDKVFNIAADIDAEDYTWASIWLETGNNNMKGSIINGNGHSIKNLTITGGAMFGGTPNGQYSDVPMTIKNLTIDSASVTEGPHFNAVFWGTTYGDVAFENVVVKNSEIGGNCNVGAFVGGTALEGTATAEISFKDCAVNGTTLTATGATNPDPTGASGFVGRAFGKTSLKFEGENTIDEATTITNNNGLVGGRVYAYTTHIDGNWEGTGVCDTFTNWDGVSIAAKVGTTTYPTIEAAIAAAKAGDTVMLVDDVTVSTLTLPAGIVFNGNGKQINGAIVAGGDLTFAGHTKVTSFSASYYNRTITIGEGACLEVTGTGRVSLAYGNTFDIIGDVTDAKTADKTDIQPSLIIPGGISITGGNNAVMSIKDAYVQIGSTTSKNSAANGTFTLNIENSIAEFTSQLTFSEPTNGNTPEFNMNIKNSVVTMGTKLIAAAPGCNIKVDNSTVNIATYFRNSGKFELVNGSVLTGSTIQFGENGGNDGETIVDNSKFTINATNAGHALDGKGTGSLTIKNGAEAIVDYYKAMTVSVDATSTFTGTEVQ